MAGPQMAVCEKQQAKLINWHTCVSTLKAITQRCNQRLLLLPKTTVFPVLARKGISDSPSATIGDHSLGTQVTLAKAPVNIPLVSAVPKGLVSDPSTVQIQEGIFVEQNKLQHGSGQDELLEQRWIGDAGPVCFSAAELFPKRVCRPALSTAAPRRTFAEARTLPLVLEELQLFWVLGGDGPVPIWKLGRLHKIALALLLAKNIILVGGWWFFSKGRRLERKGSVITYHLRTKSFHATQDCFNPAFSEIWEDLWLIWSCRKAKWSPFLNDWCSDYRPSAWATEPCRL